MWRTIPASAFLRRLMALSVGLLVAMLLAMLVVVLPVAHASHVPDCAGLHPTNMPTAGNDDINGTAGNDVLAGGAGDDQIRGLDGRDVICGNDGKDTIHGGSGADSLDGGPGPDVIEGGDDFDDLFGGEGNYGDDLYASTIFTGPIPEWPQTCQTNGELMGVSGPAESGDGEVTPTPPAWPYFGPANELFGGDGYDELEDETKEYNRFYPWSQVRSVGLLEPQAGPS